MNIDLATKTRKEIAKERKGRGTNLD